ncbi:Putative transmembrane cytochrome bd-II oxidase subunit II [Alloalcanivorax dieselolei B5]|uniref:Putative transmembrane cytochrome bd-II oxidase subunit II n=1 Tax=Alcanivorax dieselolei (strain DSM 16502 / CGMCC 1.3690 / MCCC 1A00001 / B-5) TaxID=930169 RepID=K0CIF4_ALCDB|nr:cytochrome d ubiquinol oxidase subunit II [Alloalcanivorax dieselolei]AFT71316.1 Putative transmembrane cytochrome bd-II oxidase subunit II [Alloalcanivorax dieselolei B5]GGJ94800.1 cytochrome d ubiquinol oxidase subunit II [Alloalcanivorax dieselolei]
MIFDYEMLRLIWWALLGVLLVAFAVTDGFDMGVAALLPAVARSDGQRRQVINTVGPVWEGNQVWFILGGGAIFAAWPALYAVSFSGFYLAMFLILSALIIRPVAFKFRSKREETAWRARWDAALCFSGVVPALIFGVAVGNVLQGVPFHFDSSLRPFYTGSFFALLNPFALLCGLVSLAMLMLHGATWLQIKADGEPAERARKYGMIAAVVVIVLFAIGGFWVSNMDGYRIVTAMDPQGPSNPLRKEVVSEAGIWLNNYRAQPVLWLVPLAGFAGAALALMGLFWRVGALSFLGSKLSVAAIITTVGVSMFPVILPSSTDPGHSLTVWDSSSSHYTLGVMLFATVVFLPIILLYTAWVYKVLWGKVRESDVNKDMY